MSRNLRAGVCVGAAIFRGEALLLLRRVPDHPGFWELPGGSVEPGETLETALRREVTEETGLAVTIGRPFYASTFEAPADEGGSVTVVAVEYLCRSLSNDRVRLSPTEHDAFAWVRRQDLGEYPLVAGFRAVVPEAFRWQEDGGVPPAAPLSEFSPTGAGASRPTRRKAARSGEDRRAERGGAHGP